jgi:hypothetical protein
MPKWWVGKFTMTKEAPAVLVLARYRISSEAARVASALSRQSHARARLVFVAPEEFGSLGVVTPTHEICRREGLANCLETSGADYLFYWPDEGDLHEAALEKLLLALHLAPDQHGVTDASRGANDLLLTRLDRDTPSFALRWLEAKIKWLTEIQRRKLSFFFIDETLSREPHGSDGDFGAVENAFVRLPYLFENYRSISNEPVWPQPAEPADPRSVLFLVSSPPMGDACKFLLDVVAQLKERDYRVTVATTAHYTNDPNPWLGELLRITPDVFVLPHARPVELPRLIAHLARTRRCGRVVISHSMLGYQLLPWLRTQLPGVSFLDYTHTEYKTEWPDGGYALRRERQTVSMPNFAICHEIATLAMDHVRLMHQGGLASDYGHDMRELVAKRDKTIAKLQRQLDEARTALQEIPTYAAIC